MNGPRGLELQRIRCLPRLPAGPGGRLAVGARSFKPFFLFHIADSILEGIDRYTLGLVHVISSLSLLCLFVCPPAVFLPSPPVLSPLFPFFLIDQIHCRAGRSQCAVVFCWGLVSRYAWFVLGFHATQPLKKVFWQYPVGVFVLVLSLSTESLHTPTIKFGIDFYQYVFPGN